MSALPPCGLYRTTQPLAGIPAGRLVYFHNHGDPGPGIYLPRAWTLNRADWNTQGFTLPDPAAAQQALEALPAEGLYAVKEAFHCCERRCTHYHAGQLVQLGYDGEAAPILFVPEWSARGLGFPERGTRLDRAELDKLALLTVPRAKDEPKDGFLH